MGETSTSLITPTRQPPVTESVIKKETRLLLETFGKMSTMPLSEAEAYRDTIKENLVGVRAEAFIEAVRRYRGGLCGRDINQMSYMPSPAQVCALARKLEVEIRAAEYEEQKRQREATPAITGPAPVYVSKEKIDELAARLRSAGRSL